jgi:hypothetical protein
MRYALPYAFFIGAAQVLSAQVQLGHTTLIGKDNFVHQEFFGGEFDFFFRLHDVSSLPLRNPLC